MNAWQRSIKLFSFIKSHLDFFATDAVISNPNSTTLTWQNTITLVSFPKFSEGENSHTPFLLIKFEKEPDY